MLLLSKLYSCLVTVLKTSRIQSFASSRRYLTQKPNLNQSCKDKIALNAVEVRKIQIKSFVNYTIAIVLFISGLGFAAVPLFNAFCSVTNYAGTISTDFKKEHAKSLKRVEDYELTVLFTSTKSSYLQWNFKPVQGEIKVSPGETVLAFYSAENTTDHPVSGISTYNVVPFEAAKYFNKIQCFCFDEQRLNPYEQVDMPVFFYIDPEYINDPYLQGVKNITLSYSFFEAIEGLDLPFMSSLRNE